MRIVFIVGEFPALSETFILNQITGLIERGHDVEVYAEKARKESKVHGDFAKFNLAKKTLYRPPMPGNKLLRLLKGIFLAAIVFPKEPKILFNSLNCFRYGREAISLHLLYAIVPFIRRKPYDIIHAHFGPNGLLAMRLRQIGAVHGKLITTFHGYDMTVFPKQYGARVYDKLFDSGDLFLPISQHWLNRLIEMGGDPKKMIVHRMGVNLESLHFRPRFIPGNRLVRIVTVARLVEKKGIEFAIRAVTDLLKKYPGISYEIAGDGPLKKKLLSLISELGASDSIRLLGLKNSNEIGSLLSKAHILLAPSITAENGDQEGIPVALMEAMAMGIPVVSTSHSGIPELIDNEISGFLVPERDVESLALMITALIEHAGESERFAICGREKIAAEFDVKKLNHQLENIFESIQDDTRT